MQFNFYKKYAKDIEREANKTKKKKGGKKKRRKKGKKS